MGAGEFSLPPAGDWKGSLRPARHYEEHNDLDNAGEILEKAVQVPAQGWAQGSSPSHLLGIGKGVFDQLAMPTPPSRSRSESCVSFSTLQHLWAHPQVNFKSVDEIASVWCEWVEMLLRHEKSARNGRQDSHPDPALLSLGASAQLQLVLTGEVRMTW